MIFPTFSLEFLKALFALRDIYCVMRVIVICILYCHEDVGNMVFTVSDAE